MRVLRIGLLFLLAAFMTLIGIQHFLDPQPFVDITPEALPYRLQLVYISGAMEIALGLGLLPPQTRRFAAWGLIALYVAVFPANVNMAINDIVPTGSAPIPKWALWLRLPLQLVLIAWAYWYTRGRPQLGRG